MTTRPVQNPFTVGERPAPLVVKIGGAAVEPGADAGALWAALALLARTEPGGLVVVHGGGASIERRLARAGLTSKKIEGVRVTTPEIVEEIVATLAGVTNLAVVTAIQRAGVKAVGLTLSDAGLTRLRPTTRYTFDAQRVGEILGGDPTIIATMLGAGVTPVVCSVGAGEDGLALNVNADEAAASIARCINARALILLTDVDSVLDAHGAPIGSLSIADAESLITSGAATEGMVPKLRAAIEAAHACSAPTAIASWKRADELPLLAAGEPAAAGTWIHPAATAAHAQGAPA